MTARALQSSSLTAAGEAPQRPALTRSGCAFVCKSKFTKNKLRVPSPIDAVILTVDTARVSGWAQNERGHLIEFGELNAATAKGGEQMGVICRNVRGAACNMGIPAVLVLEVPYSQGRTGQGLAKRVGAWEMAWLTAGNHANKILHKTASEWRSGVGFAGLDRDAARSMEMTMARTVLGSGREIGSDAAAAICMGQWARCAVPVLDVLPVSKRKLVGHG